MKYIIIVITLILSLNILAQENNMQISTIDEYSIAVAFEKDITNYIITEVQDNTNVSSQYSGNISIDNSLVISHLKLNTSYKLQVVFLDNSRQIYTVYKPNNTHFVIKRERY